MLFILLDAFPVDLAIRYSGAVLPDHDIFPFETVSGNIREYPISILLIQDFPYELISFFGKTKPLHAMITCVANVITFVCGVEHTQR